MRHMELLEMNKTTRNLLFIAIASVFLVLLSACGGDSEDEQPLVTVTEDVEDTAVVEVAPTYTPVEPTDMPPIPSTAVSTATSVPSIQANGNVNVRSGPGTDYDLVGLLSNGQSAVVIGTSGNGDWFNVQLSDGTIGWVGSSVVDSSSVDSSSVHVAATVAAPAAALPPTVSATAVPATATVSAPVVAESPTTVPATAVPAATQQAVPSPTNQVAAAMVVIVGVNKSAEYVDIRNSGGQPQELSGWMLRSERGSQDCGLNGVIEAGATLRVWAMAEDVGQGGFNCEFGSNIWNNSKSDPAVLFNAQGQEVSRW